MLPPNASWPVLPVDRLRVVPLAVLLSLLIVLIVGGNVIVILAVLYERKLRTACNFYVVSLSVADLLLGLVILPLSSVREVLQRWPFGAVLCRIWLTSDVFCCTASILSLCAISVDRWRAISRPMRYPQYSTGRRARINILIVWLLALGISAPPLFGWGLAHTDNGACELTSGTTYVVYSACGSFFVPALIMLVFYRHIFVIATRQRLRIQRSAAVPCCSEVARLHRRRSKGAAAAATAAATRAAAVSSLGSLDSALLAEMQLHLKGALAKRLRGLGAQTKAAKTLAIVVGAFIGCWGPFFVVYLLRGVCRSCVVPDDLMTVCVWIGYCNSFLNPVIYPCLSRDFRDAFGKLLRRYYCRKHRLRSGDPHPRHLRSRSSRHFRRFAASEFSAASSPPDSPFGSRSTGLYSCRSGSLCPPRDSLCRARPRSPSRISTSTNATDPDSLASSRVRGHLLSFKSDSSRDTRLSLFSTDSKLLEPSGDLEPLPLGPSPTATPSSEEAEPLGSTQQLAPRSRTNSLPSILHKMDLKLWQRSKRTKKEEKGPEEVGGWGSFVGRRASVAGPVSGKAERKASLCPDAGDQRSIYTIEEGSRIESSRSSLASLAASLSRHEVSDGGQEKSAPSRRDSLTVAPLGGRRRRLDSPVLSNSGSASLAQIFSEAASARSSESSKGSPATQEMATQTEATAEVHCERP